MENTAAAESSFVTLSLGSARKKMISHLLDFSARKAGLFFLVTLLSVVRAQAADETSKPVVYDPIQKKPDVASEQTVHEKYKARYRIIDLRDDNGFVPGRMRNYSWTGPLPRDAAGKRIVGSCTVIFVVSAQGKAESAFLLSSTSPLLDRPVTEWVNKEWVGRPSRLNGVPVATVCGQKFKFEKLPSNRNLPGFAEEAAVDAKGVRHLASKDPDGVAPWMEDVDRRVNIQTNASELRFQGQVTGVLRLTLDLKTGNVIDAVVLKSTGHPALDQDARVALRKWHWRPGHWRSVDIPVAFGSGAPARFDEHDFPPALAPHPNRP